MHDSVDHAMINIQDISLFAIGDETGLVTLWDTNTLEMIQSVNLKYPINSFEFDNDNKNLLVNYKKSSFEYAIQGFKISNSNLNTSHPMNFEKKELVLHMISINSKRKLVSEDLSWDIQIWDLDTAAYLMKIHVEGDDWITRGDGLGYYPKKNLLIVPGANTQYMPFLKRVNSKTPLKDQGQGSLKFFDLDSGEEQSELLQDIKRVDKFVEYDDEIYVFDTLAGLSILQDEENVLTLLNIRDEDLRSFAYSKGEDLIMITTAQNYLLLARRSTGELIRKLIPFTVEGESNTIYLEKAKSFIITLNL